MQLRIELTEGDVKELIVRNLEEKFNMSIPISNIHIQVKSKQNYKSEWEDASFRAVYEYFATSKEV